MNKERVHKGYRVELRRQLSGNVVSWLDIDIFVEDIPDSDRELVAAVFRDYPGFSVNMLQRLAV